MGNKVKEALEKASTCPGCGHSNPAGVAGCDCTRSDCSCATTD